MNERKSMIATPMFISNLEEENKYLRECVETWKWCFNRMEEQNTKILLHYLDNEE